MFGARPERGRKDCVMCSLQIPVNDLGLHPKNKIKSLERFITVCVWGGDARGCSVEGLRQDDVRA